MDYSTKLKSPKWQKKRLEVFNRDNFSCRTCGDTETELHVHHLKYTGEPWDAPLEDLQTLCKDCHFYFTFRYIELTKIYQLEDLNFVRNHKVSNAFISEFETKVFILHSKPDTLSWVAGFDKNSSVLDKITQIIKSNG